MSEILGTLFKYLMATLAVGAVLAASHFVQQKMRASSAIADISQIVPKIQGLYLQQSDYSGISLAQLLPANIVPVDWASGINQWSGNVLFQQGIGKSFLIDLYGVPDSACINILLSVTGAAWVTTSLSSNKPLPLDYNSVAASCIGNDGLGGWIEYSFQ